MQNDPLEAARAVAFRYLGVSARSRAEMERRLSRDEFPQEVIESVLVELEAGGYLDDAKFARDWIEDRADRKRYGKSRLAAELRRKGLDRDLLEETLSGVTDQEELDRARAAASPRWDADAYQAADAQERAAIRRRISGFLQRRGFGWSVITQVLAELTPNRD